MLASRHSTCSSVWSEIVSDRCKGSNSLSVISVMLKRDIKHQTNEKRRNKKLTTFETLDAGSCALNSSEENYLKFRLLSVKKK